MNIITYLFMSLIGWTGAHNELKNRRSDTILLYMFLLFFIMTVCSRIGHYKEDSPGDLDYYLYAFKEGEFSYFSIGYVAFNYVTKFLSGDNSYIFLSIVAIWILTSILISCSICHNNTSWVNKRNYSITLLFVLSLYWGIFFCDVIRTGLAMSFVYCSFSYAVNNCYKKAVFCIICGSLFHISSLIFIIAIIAMFFHHFFNRNRLKRIFFLMIAIDVVIAVFHISLMNVGTFFEFLTRFEELEHFGYYSEDEVGTYLSTQYLTYHIFGLIMLYGNFSNDMYKKSVIVYYIGLIMGTLFQFTIIYMRIQWIFLPIIIFVLYFFFIDENMSSQKKIRILASYSIIQAVMIIRQFGWYL